jgi:hypothetical protein
VQLAVKRMDIKAMKYEKYLRITECTDQSPRDAEVAQRDNNCPRFIETESSLLWSEQPITCPYPELNECNLNSPTLLPSDPIWLTFRNKENED